MVGIVGWRARARSSALFSLSSLPPTGQQVPGFPTAPTRVVIARPTPPQSRPSHPRGPPQTRALGRRDGGDLTGQGGGGRGVKGGPALGAGIRIRDQDWSWGSKLAGKRTAMELVPLSRKGD